VLVRKKQGHIDSTADTSDQPSNVTRVEMQKLRRAELHGAACKTAASGNPGQMLNTGSATSSSKFQSQISRSPSTILKMELLVLLLLPHIPFYMSIFQTYRVLPNVHSSVWQTFQISSSFYNEDEKSWEGKVKNSPTNGD